MRLDNVELRVGVFGGQYPDGTPVADVALYLEYGTRDSREYAFMRKAFEQNRQKYDKMLSDGYVRITRGELTQFQLLHRIGQTVVEDIRDSLKAEGLIDTKRLYDAVRYEVQS